MAIHLEFNYGKKLGLPGYSSHNFNVSVRSEVSNPEDILPETQRVYSILQGSVDSQIRNVGFIPGDHVQNTQQEPQHTQNTGNVNKFPGNEPQGPAGSVQGASAWKCSPKQTDLILKIMEENQLPVGWADNVAKELHGKSMSGLTKLEASGVVSEFISRFRRRRGNANQQNGGHRQ